MIRTLHSYDQHISQHREHIKIDLHLCEHYAPTTNMPLRTQQLWEIITLEI